MSVYIPPTGVCSTVCALEHFEGRPGSCSPVSHDETLAATRRLIPGGMKTAVSQKKKSPRFLIIFNGNRRTSLTTYPPSFHHAAPPYIGLVHQKQAQRKARKELKSIEKLRNERERTSGMSENGRHLAPFADEDVPKPTQEFPRPRTSEL